MSERIKSTWDPQPCPMLPHGVTARVQAKSSQMSDASGNQLPLRRVLSTTPTKPTCYEISRNPKRDSELRYCNRSQNIINRDHVGTVLRRYGNIH